MTFAILVVCTGNICRSPYAEALLRDRLRAGGCDIAVTSAGTHAVVGAPIHSSAGAELARRGVVADAFRARQLTPAAVASADLVLTMTRDHRSRVLEEEPRALRRTFTLREFAGLVRLLEPADAVTDLRAAVAAAAAARSRLSEHAVDSLDIADPFGRSDDAYAAMAREVDAAVESIVDRMLRPAGR